MNRKTITFFSLVIVFSAIVLETVSAVQKTYVSIEKIQAMCSSVYHKAQQDHFTPELLVGVSRGGLIPLGFLAGDQLFNNRNTKIISIRSYDDQYHQKNLTLLLPVHEEELKKFTSILIIDDIADAGKTLEYVRALLAKELPMATIKTATLFYKNRSVIKPDYYVEETGDWIVFPWE